MGTVAAGKAGLRNYLRSTEGLRAADGVTVRSIGTVLPEEMSEAMILLGPATVTETGAGLQSRAEQISVACWAMAVKPGAGETALDTARDAAEDLFDRARAALKADPSAAETIRPPGRVVVTSGGLEESAVSWDGAAAYRVDRSFSLSWTSHS